MEKHRLPLIRHRASRQMGMGCETQVRGCACMLVAVSWVLAAAARKLSIQPAIMARLTCKFH